MMLRGGNIPGAGIRRGMLIIATLAAIFAVSFAGAVRAQMLNGAGENSLFSDIRAHNVGDIITIHIIEYSQGKNEANTRSTKESKTGAGSSSDGLFKFIPLSGLSMNDQVDFSGKGSTDRAGVLRAKMTARIKSIAPGGHLEIEGFREVEVNNEKMLMTLTGVIRQQDIAFDNSIMSYQIADAKISYKGKGHINTSQKPGLLTRLFNWIF